LTRYNFDEVIEKALEMHKSTNKKNQAPDVNLDPNQKGCLHCSIL
jgi:hypothetical protein